MHQGGQEQTLLKRSLPLMLIAFLAGGTFGIASAETSPFAATGSADPTTSQQTIPLTPDQLRATAANLVTQIGQETLSLRRRLDEARKRRDVVRLLCLDDKAKQADLVTSSARDRESSLANAVQRDDTERARHDFTVIAALRQRMRTVSMEASQCVGEELGFIDDAKVIVQVDPALPSLDPTRLPPDPIFSDPPMVSSPTR